MQIFFQNKNKNITIPADALEAACDGLVYVSETDVPIQPFYGAAATEVTREIILQQTGGNAETVVEELSFDDFFDRLTAIKDWFGEPEKARSAKFLQLRKLLEEFPSQRKVFKLGRVRVAIFAVGIDADGRLMGVTTKAVET